jgi:hypothetical protein
MTAEYAFVESESNVMRYEVRCRRCDEVYSEDSESWALAVARDDEPLMQWPPDYETVAARDWRVELRARFDGSARQGREMGEAIGLRARALAERARAELSGRLRAVRNS